MKLNIEYILEDNISKEDMKYLNSTKKQIKNLISYIVLNELYMSFGQDISSFIKNISVSISFVSEESIKSLNAEYRNIDKITDVLSFPMQDEKEIRKIKRYINKYKKDNILDAKYKMYKELILGDIFICLPKIIEQSKEYTHSLKRELMYMVTHGIYHLLSYDHEQEIDKKKMRSKEKAILKKFNYGLRCD